MKKITLALLSLALVAILASCGFTEEELNNAVNDAKAPLEGQITTLTDEKNDLLAEIAELEAAADALNTEKATLEAKVTDLEAKIEKLLDCAAGDHADRYTINKDGTHTLGCEWCDRADATAHHSCDENGDCVCGFTLASIEALPATYGQTLADVALPDGWAWEDASASVGNVGKHTFTAVYAPADGADDSSARSVSIVVAVQKAIPVVTPGTPKEGMIFNGLYFSLFSRWPKTTGGTLMYKVNDGEWSNTLVNRQWAAGTYTVYYKVVGDENYESVDEVSFTVTVAHQKLDEIAPRVTLAFESCAYDGTAKTPAVTVVADLPYVSQGMTYYNGGVILMEGTDFTVTYSDNVAVGTATVTIEGIGSFTGTITKTFEITPDPATGEFDGEWA